MKKITQRLLVFFIGLPLIVGIVVLLPHHYHLTLNLLVVIFSALGAVEFSILLTPKQLSISKGEAAVLGALPPLVMLLMVNFGLHDLFIAALISAVVVWLLMSRLFSRDNLDSFINRIIAGFAVLLYPGMLIAWLVRMSRWDESASIIIMVFLAAVFCTDGTAWATGMLFGRGNQGLIQASPHKSIAGFIGGIIAAILVGAGAAAFWPDIFITKYNMATGIAGALLGLVTGIAATLGDLGESAIKRSSGIKDSGSIIPGRGGVLDSIDSITLAAPVFYLVFSVLFAHP